MSVLAPPASVPCPAPCCSIPHLCLSLRGPSSGQVPFILVPVLLSDGFLAPPCGRPMTQHTPGEEQPGRQKPPEGVQEEDSQQVRKTAAMTLFIPPSEIFVFRLRLVSIFQVLSVLLILGVGAISYLADLFAAGVVSVGKPVSFQPLYF